MTSIGNTPPRAPGSGETACQTILGSAMPVVGKDGEANKIDSLLALLGSGTRAEIEQGILSQIKFIEKSSGFTATEKLDLLFEIAKRADAKGLDVVVQDARRAAQGQYDYLKEHVDQGSPDVPHRQIMAWLSLGPTRKRGEMVTGLMKSDKDRDMCLSPDEIPEAEKHMQRDTRVALNRAYIELAPPQNDAGGVHTRKSGK